MPSSADKAASNRGPRSTPAPVAARAVAQNPYPISLLPKALAFRSQGNFQFAASGNQSVGVQLPSGWAAGEFCVILIGGIYSTSITPPAGWTSFGSRATIGSGSGSPYLHAYYRFLQAGDGTASFNFNTNTGGMVAVSLTFTGVDPVTPFEDYLGGQSGTQGVAAHDKRRPTTLGADRLVISAEILKAVQAGIPRVKSFGASDVWQLLHSEWSSDDNWRLVVHQYLKATAGQVPQETLLWTTTGGDWASLGFALVPIYQTYPATEYSAPGTYTATPPPGATMYMIDAYAGGGSSEAGNPGGGGGFARKNWTTFGAGLSGLHVVIPAVVAVGAGASRTNLIVRENNGSGTILVNVTSGSQTGGGSGGTGGDMIVGDVGYSGGTAPGQGVPGAGAGPWANAVGGTPGGGYSAPGVAAEAAPLFGAGAGAGSRVGSSGKVVIRWHY